jgi:transcriptional regulator with XRE-family HTH domain
MTDQELAATVKAWRTERSLTIREAAEYLGMSRRTLEGVEQGRGFTYPTLLIAGIEQRRAS